MRHLLLSTAASVLLLTACTERIELDLDELAAPKLVVEGWITDQPMAHRVRLTTTRSYYANEATPRVSGAQVTLTDGVQTWTLTEQPAGSGNYFTPADAAGVVGRHYTLTIQHNGDTWTATDLMRPVPALDSVAFDLADREVEEGEAPWYDVRIWTQELPGLGDHYRWKTYVNGYTRSDSLKAASFVDDRLYDGSAVAGVVVDQVQARPGDTIRVEQHAITKEAHDVILAILQNTEWRGGLFDPPPANVPSNISNGGLGFFGAASVKDRTGIVP